jgi:N-acetylneuraminic acid mutarotase
VRHRSGIGWGLGFILAFIFLGVGGLGLAVAQAATPAPDAPPPPATKPGPPLLGTQDQAGPPPTNPGPRRRGGPDAFGYVFDDSNEPGGPAFNWIAATDVITRLRQDDYTVTVSLPFALNFYGVVYNNLYISTNGNLQIASTDWRDYDNVCLPDPTYTRQLGIIAPFWDDMYLMNANGGDVYTSVVGTAPNRIYVVEWRNVEFYQRPGTRVTVETLIYENNTGWPNEIRFQYGPLSGPTGGGSSATVGLQSYDHTTGISYSCNTESVQQGLAIRFMVPPTVLLYPGNQAGGGAPGTTLTYTGRVINQTPLTNSFTLNLSGASWPTTLVPTQTNPISPTYSTPFTIVVSIPPCLPVGSASRATLLASSTLPRPGAYTATMQVSSVVSTPGATFTPATRAQAGAPATTVYYTSTLTNQSGDTTRYLLSPAGNSWTTTITPTDVTLPNNASVPVQVSVQIPGGAPLGASDTVTVTARQEPPGTCPYIGQAVFTTTLGAWTHRSNPGYVRDRHALISYPPTGRVYAIGGETVGPSLNLRIEAFDPVANTWTRHAYLRVGVSNIGAALLGNDIYIPGGYDGNGASTWLQVFHPLSDTVTVIYSDPLPAPRYGAGVASAAGKLYVIGGSDGVSTTHTVFEYDPARPATARWQRKADLPTARVFLGAAALDGLIYAVGGSPGALTDLATVEIYNPATDSWTSGPPLSVPRSGLAVTAANNGDGCGPYLYAMGGGWFTYRATAERYNPATNTWSSLSDLTQARRSLAAAWSANGNQLVVHGGWNDYYVPTTEALGCGGPGPSPTPTPPGGFASPTPPPAPTAPATPCALPFGDVQPSDYFYAGVQGLYCQGVISGYGTEFRPYFNATRGQLSKMVALAYGWDLTDPGPQRFEDVPPANTFFAYVNTAASRGLIQGYPCGGPFEPCLPPANRPYFRPNNNITRGQLTKIIVGAAEWPLLVPPTATFSDVPVGSTFFEYIETAVRHRILGGYPDATFRPNNNAIRGQLSKILWNALTLPLLPP